jgi:hypothetical protein
LNDYLAKLRSLALNARPTRSKTTVDVHDTHTVEVTEHGTDQQAVVVKPKTIRVSMNVEEQN